MSAQDKPSFSTSGESIWGPHGGTQAKTFKTDILDLPYQAGTIGEVWGGDVQVDTANYKGEPSFLCPSGTVFGVDGCYDTCPAGTVQTGNLCTGSVSPNDAGQYGCSAGERWDGLNSCYACPTGYYRDGLGFCRADTSATDEGDADVSYTCPSGYSVAWYTAGVLCEKTTWSCPSGWSEMSPNLIGQECYKNWSYSHKDCFLGICGSTHTHSGTDYTWKESSTSYADPTVVLGCPSGEFLYVPNGHCYSCPSGYSNNGSGGCTKTTNDVYAHNYYCDAGEFANASLTRCLVCPSGSTEVAGVCVTNSTVSKVADVQFICPSPQWLSLVPSGCYECDSGWDHNPALGATTPGVCFQQTFSPNNPGGTFQLGMQATFDYRFRWGINGGITLDEGSVNVNYDPSISVNLVRPGPGSGPEVVTIQTSQAPANSALSMSTTWPGIDMYLDTYIDAATSLTGHTVYTEILADGIHQRDNPFTIFNQATDGEQPIDPNYPLANMHVGLDGIHLDVVGNRIVNFVGGLDPPIELVKPVLEYPGLPTVGYVVAELGVTTPDMYTPARTNPPYDGITGTIADLTSSGSSTFARNYIRPGPRNQIDFGILTTAAQDPDFSRIDLDLDGIYAVATNKALGVKVSQPTAVPGISWWSVNASALDLDGGMIFSIQEDFKFNPNLKVRLTFSKPVELETAPGSGIFSTATSRIITVGQDLKFVHPGGQLSIDTQYSVSGNTFTNDTDLMLTPIFEGQVLSLQYDILGRPPIMPNRFAALQVTRDLAPAPIKLANLNFYDGSDKATFPLTGFSDESGTQLSIVGRNAAPTAVCTDPSVDLNAQGLATLLAAQVNDGSTDPDIPNGDYLTFSLDTTSLSCSDIPSTSVTLTAADSAGASDSCVATVSVRDVTAPNAVAGGASSGDEGSTVAFNAGGSSDACGGLTYQWQFSDGSSASGATSSHAFCNNGNYSATLTATDGSGNLASDTWSVAIANVAPFVEAGQALTVNEGSPVELLGAATSDPGDDSLTASVSWGGSNPSTSGDLQLFSDPGVCGVISPVHASYTYPDNGLYTVRVTVTDSDGASGSDTTLVTVRNVAPTVEAGPAQTANEGSVVQFHGAASDPGNDPLSYSWNFGDGQSAQGQDVSHVYADNGIFTATLTVSDGDGGVTSDSLTVTVLNVAPTAFLPLAANGDEGSAVHIAGSFSDPGTLDTYTVRLQFGDGTEAASLTADHVYADEGLYTVLLTVTDKDGGTGTSTMQVLVQNVAPTARIRGQETCDEGSACPSSGSAVDPGVNDVLTFNWDFGDGGKASGPSPSHVYVDDGVYTITLTVDDGDGGIGTDTFVVTVNNVAPTASAGQNQTADEGSPVAFSASATDPGTRDVLSFTWDFGDGGTGSGAAPSHVYADEGVYTATVTVDDGDGGGDSDALVVTVNNVAPTASAGPNQKSNEGSPVTFSASASDPGVGDVLTYTWSFGDGGTGSGPAPSHTYADNGVYTATVTVDDGDGGSDADSLVVTVNNVAPSVSAGADQSVDEGSPATVSGAFFDPGADTWSYQIVWGDGSPAQAALGATHVYADDGVYDVVITVTDDDGASGSDTLSITVNNVAPTVEAGDDQSADEGSPVTVAGSFTDPGADTWTLFIDWGDGSPLSPGLSATHVYADNDVYTVTISVEDDDGGLGTDTLQVDVSNVAPTGDAGADQHANEGDVLSFAGTYSDPGTADTFSFAWDFGDGGSSTDLAPTHAYADNGTYTVTFTVTDDDGGSHTDSLTVTTDNVAPTGDAGSDQQANEGDVVSFAGTYSDPGAADTFSFAWDFGDGGSSTDLAPSHVYADNGTYTVTFKVTDDDGGTHSDSLQVVIANVAPTVEAGADLGGDEGSAVSFAASFADPGSADTHTVHVDFGDGSPPATTLNASHVYADDGTYTATVTVTDDDGGVGSDTLTVTVHNVAPAVAPLPDVGIFSGGDVAIESLFTDAGVRDTHSAQVDWGDGTQGAMTLDQGNGSGSAHGQHRYFTLGRFHVTVTVTDNAGGSSSSSFDVGVERLPILIDIKPGSSENTVNVGSNGVIAVGILSTPSAGPGYEAFNALDIDASTLRFGPGGAPIAHKAPHVQDVNGDGLPDLLVHFRTQDAGLDAGTTGIALIGATTDGRSVSGADLIRSIPENSIEATSPALSGSGGSSGKKK